MSGSKKFHQERYPYQEKLIHACQIALVQVYGSAVFDMPDGIQPHGINIDSDIQKSEANVAFNGYKFEVLYDEIIAHENSRIVGVSILSGNMPERRVAFQLPYGNMMEVLEKTTPKLQPLIPLIISTFHGNAMAVLWYQLMCQVPMVNMTDLKNRIELIYLFNYKSELKRLKVYVRKNDCEPMESIMEYYGHNRIPTKIRIDPVYQVNLV